MGSFLKKLGAVILKGTQIALGVVPMAAPILNAIAPGAVALTLVSSRWIIAGPTRKSSSTRSTRTSSSRTAWNPTSSC